MAVFFSASESQVVYEDVEFQQVPKPEPQHAAAAAEKKTKPRLKYLGVFLLGFGLLFILQAVLNISLRLSLNDKVCAAGLKETEEYSGETEEYSGETEEYSGETEEYSGETEEYSGETEEDKCPQNWITFGSSCYYLSRTMRNWNESRQDCLQRGADLAIINSMQEQGFLTDLAEIVWVGMTDRRQEGNWIWVDGTPVDIDRLFWAQGQPDNIGGNEDCGEIRKTRNFNGLNDKDCNIRQNWFCEKKLRERNMR